MSWTRVKLGEITRMKYGKMPPADILSEDGFPVFSGYRITGCCKEYLYDEPRVIVVARGVGGTGDVKISPEKCWITNLSIVLDHYEDKVDKQFLYYRLGQEPLKDKLNTGAAQAQITIDSLSPYEITIPNISVQKSIASILSTYDDLIENNRRRMALLEDAARQVYQEWFVRLRFPGYEHTRIVGVVPEGWERKTLRECLTLNYGKALKADIRVDGPFPVYGSSGIVGSHEKALVPGPAIILGRKGNVGSVFWANKDFYPIDTVYFINAESSSFYLYYALKNMHFMSTDVAVPGLNRDFAYSRELLLPPNRILRSFIETVTPMHEQLSKLDEMNQKLRAARDLLLPKLMSGEVEV